MRPEGDYVLALLQHFFTTNSAKNESNQKFDSTFSRRA
jgi:hypothetical protein